MSDFKTPSAAATPQNAPSEQLPLQLTDLFSPPPVPPPPGLLLDERTPTAVVSNERTSLLLSSTAGDDAFRDLKAWRDDHRVQIEAESDTNPCAQAWHNLERKLPWLKSLTEPTTTAGAFMFVLYHVVFVLAFGSAMQRPHGKTPMLGLFAKYTSVGILAAGPLYIARLNADIPAVYPSVDLFLAPFVAQAAVDVDESLWQQQQQQSTASVYNDAVFLGTLAVLTSLGMALAGAALWLGSTVRLANLGTYLPYSVLAGFFSAVGVLMWALALAVDTGQSWKQVLASGDLAQMSQALRHHLPSLLVGILMNRLGPKNPFYVILLIVVTIASFYAVMAVTGTSLEEAQAAGWFWSVHELVYDYNREREEWDFLHTNTTTATAIPWWTLPPAPLGSWAAVVAGHVNWKAVGDGLGHMAALAFLYLLRSSIHASAMKKNVGNLVRRIPMDHTLEREPNTDQESLLETTTRRKNQRPSVLSKLTQSIRMVQMSMQDPKALKPQTTNTVPSNASTHRIEYREIRATPPRRSLESIFREYSYALFVVAMVGGFGVCPTVATSNTMYAIGADKAAPQYGSILLLIVFYVLDFRMVQYIPKTAFSSLLVLGAVDTFVVWFFGAYRKTLDVIEWLVVPFITAFSLVVGFLNAVFLGIAISTFVFVASFFRVGVVKYSASGLEIRSRVERSVAQSAWLSENGDLCQIIVLQNYLFFGNACSILDYVATMFEEVDKTQSERLDFALPPLPRVLVLDLSLVTGMDTSTTDIFNEIFELCKSNDCKLYFCGLSIRMKKGLALGGVKPDAGPRSQSQCRFFADLDSALGRAEDALIQTEMELPSPRSLARNRSSESLDGGRGFLRALQQIDELHGLSYARQLFDLYSFVDVVELKPGDHLYKSDGGVIEGGLFFIEDGLLKIERDSTQSLTLTRTRGSVGSYGNKFTLKNQHARMGSVARRAALAKGVRNPLSTNIRLARLGPGWVCGTLNVEADLQLSGITVAVTSARLHHLPSESLEKIEEENPSLALSLYKLVTHLRAHRQEATIEQLTTLNNIMTAPAHSKPISRVARRAIGP